MIRKRPSNERGHADHGWLNTYHTFSFSDYYDPSHMQFRSLRVMNEDWVQPGQGFGTHPHRDMEIITYVLEGELSHRDSLGSGSVLRAGELQRMTAGTGITHSEFNASATDPVHLYQVWLLPERKGLAPSYEQRAIDPAGQRGTLRLVASRDGREDSMVIQQDARVYLSELEAGERVRHDIEPGRHAWVQATRGRVDCNGTILNEGDGAAVSEESALEIRGDDRSSVMLFDLS